MLKRLMVASILMFSACGDDDDDRPAECVTIFEACHAVDPGSGPIHDCHENAEETWDQAACVANSSACLALCSAAGRDAGGT